MNAITLSVLLAATLALQTPGAPAYHLSGPYTHKNLSIFLIHGRGPSIKKLLTLQEAIDQHKVVVYETKNVNELAIENVSDQDVFIESGEIVKGGAQDRTLKDDFILPTKSGKVNISAFCVEHGRWSRRGQESVTTFGSATETVATKDLKMAVKVESDQSQVWNKVAKAQNQLNNTVGSGVRASQAPTSLAMTMIAPATQQSIDGYRKELAGIVGDKSDVIGYAFAINGKFNSADVYASHDLFTRLWPKLLRASAIEAVSEYDAAKKFAPPASGSVRAALLEAESGKMAPKNLTDRTAVRTKQSGEIILFETRDRAQGDAWIHRNYLAK